MITSLHTVQDVRKFDQHYQEEVVLRDGSRVRLRAVRPTDKERLKRGLRKLSADALMARFFTVKRRFTRRELEYLTEFDGVDHYAIGAVLLNDDGSEGEGLAVGRFVRLPDDATAAEPAVVVLDEWQNQGLGRILFNRLVDAAQQRGIRYFHTEFLPGNEGIQRLLEGICPDLIVWRRGEILVADVPLPAAHDSDGTNRSRNAFSTLLRLAAEQLIRPQLRRGLNRAGNENERDEHPENSASAEVPRS